jgi:hypothetical protein
MNPSKSYITGTAEEAIKYTAGGSSIDWLQSINVTAFVLEIVPPCDNRWCPHAARQVMRIAKREAVTASRFVELVVTGTVKSSTITRTQCVLLIALVAILSGCMLWRRRHTVLATLRRLGSKEKHVDSLEMQSLTTESR